MTPFRRIAIVNRGETAMRLIRAAREWNREHGSDLRTVALYTEPDRRALFVREADEAVALGEATFVDSADGDRKSTYLDYDRLFDAFRDAEVDAVWVGWGFVAEHAAFAQGCEERGIVFIGPTSESMRKLGDKIGSKHLAEEAGVPVAPWSGGPVEDLEAAQAQAERIGFPLMVKATAGGGGRGIRRVRTIEELPDAFEAARSEALKGFGNATVFMERLLEGARHIEVQIVGDGRGTTWALGVRDCTIQRRNQKVVEESPSPMLTADEHREVCEAAARLGQLVGYRNAGTVEFLFDPVDRIFSFMEVNTRLQVEHPVTEETTGVDLVKLQLRVALGERLEGDAPEPKGHAIEVRVNAEDPDRNFAPAPGEIQLLRFPGGPGIRVDSGFVLGDVIASEFDSMFAKVVAHGRDRAEALARLRRALFEMRIAIRGGASNKGFLLGLLEREEVETGEVDVGWLDRLAATGEHLPSRNADAALLQAAIDAYDAEGFVEQAQFYATAARGRLRDRAEVGREVELRHRGVRYELRVARTAPDAYLVTLDGKSVRVQIERMGRLECRECRIEFSGRIHRTLSVSQGNEQLVEVDGMPHRLSRDDVGVVRSPAPAVLLSFAVGEGDEVTAGDRIAVLEAMKTELPVEAPCSGKIRQILVAPHVQVGTGQALMLIEPSETEVESAAVERIRLESEPETGGADARAHCLAALSEMRSLVQGFDVDSGRTRQLLERYRTHGLELAPDDPEVLRREDEVLAIFADVCALFEQRPAEPAPGEREARTAEEYLLLYLRSLDVAAAGLSPGFVDRLQRVLRHYGIAELDRTHELEETMLWVCKAHARTSAQADVVLGILERRLAETDRLAPAADDDFRLLLDRIVGATRGRYQGVSDLALEVRWRWYDRPAFEEVRQRATRQVREHLEALEQPALADGADRAERIRALVDCPQALARLLIDRMREEPEHAATAIEVLARRYYRQRELEGIEVRRLDGAHWLRASYAHEGRRLRLLAGAGPLSKIEELVRELAANGDGDSTSESVIVDLYLWSDEAGEEVDQLEARVREALDRFGPDQPLHRCVSVVTLGHRSEGAGGMRTFTHRAAAEGGYGEDRLWRGLHPMMGKRLEVWRLANFEIERLPSAEDVYLFRGVARSNPRDERLFAFAEVRDLTPARDEAGRVTRLPHLELMYMEALAAIRVFQSRRAARRRLHWNRVLLYAWPPLDLGPDELVEIAHRLVPAAEDLGLQKTVVRARIPDPESGGLRDSVVHIGHPAGRGLVVNITPPADGPIAPLSAFGQKVVRMRQRGMTYPYELVRTFAPTREATGVAFPPGEFVEYDLDDSGRLVPVDREPGHNTANVVVGLIRHFTSKHPEGMDRMIVLGDGSREMGSVDEPECRRIIGVLDEAEQRGIPVDWFAISAGAKIALDTGTETMDWCAAVIRRLVEFTQAGGEVNVVIDGVNVGAQSYWNAEATMLMHTRGVLIMTPAASMLLTGKRALDFSGGVSAEDNQGIGGYERIMGPNGQAQYRARDVAEACQLLLRHYEHAYVAPTERFPRRAPTGDPVDRDVRAFPHGRRDGIGFDLVGEIWSDERNPGRNKPFDVRRVMAAVVDQDHDPLERWGDLREGESAVVWDAHLGGIPATLIGIESRPIQRLGFVPADGPEQWTAGTLFPLASKKVARAINAASDNRPVAILANLSGFDGSPESMRRIQLEYGAEIGRAVVNFRGPIVLCVVSRYHGGAYVVFSSVLNENLRVAALEGSFASVIGGAPAAAVVFARDVDERARSDARIQALEAEMAEADPASRGALRARHQQLYAEVRAEKLGEVAAEFDGIHSVERARRVGSLHDVLPPERLRAWLVESIEEGMRRELGEA